MRKIFAIAFVALAFPAGLQAKTLELGADAPVITIEIPDAWNPQLYPNGQASTAEDGMLVTTEVVKAADIGTAMEAAMKYFMDHGVVVDEKSEVDHEATVNGMDFNYSEWQGKDKDGPAMVTLSALILNKEQVVLIGTWGSPDADKKNSDALGAMLNSIKPVE